MNVALVGYGYWGKKIYKTLNKFIPTTNISVVDPNIEKFPVGLNSKSLKDVLLDKNINHVLIATPEETHFKIAKECLENKKNVFVEKPLCLKKQEAKELHQLAQKNNLRIFVDYIFLYDPFIKKIKEIIQKDTLGDLLQIESIRHSININKPSISVFDDLAIHDIYLGEYFFGGGINKIKVTKKQIEQAAVVFHYDEKILSADYSWVQPTAKRVMKFIGTKTTLVWDKNEENLLIYQNDKLAKKIKVKTTTSPLEMSIKKFLFEKKSYNYVEDIAILEKMSLSI